MLTTRQRNYIFLVGSLTLTLGLIPTIVAANSVVQLGSSIPVAAVLLIYGASFLSDGQKWPAVGMVLQALAWAAIAIWRH